MLAALFKRVFFHFSDSSRALKDLLKKEKATFEAQLADFPHTFQLQDLESLRPSCIKSLKSGLESALSVGYKTGLETARARNLLAFALWRLGRPDDALEQLDLVLKMPDDQRTNLVTLANKAVILWRQDRISYAEEQVKLLRQIQEGYEDFQYLVVKANAELAFSYTRLGPTFGPRAISLFSQVMPEAREPEKWLWKFGLALTRRRLLRAHPQTLSTTLATDTENEQRDLLMLFLEIASKCTSENLKAKTYAEIATLLNLVWKTQLGREFVQKVGMNREEACERALQFDDNDKSVLTKCGVIFRYVRQTDRAREVLQKALSIRPSSRIYHHLGLTYQNLATIEKYKDYVKAPKYYHKLSGASGGAASDETLLHQFGHMSIGRPGFQPSSPVSHGDAKDDMPAGSVNDGPKYSLNPDVRAMQRVIKSPPKGVTTFSRGDKFVKEALCNLEKAIEFSEGENARAIYDLALLLKRLGQLEEAEQYLQKMLKNQESVLDGDYAKAFEQIGLIKKDMADSERDESKKKQLIEDSKRMFLKALKAASAVFSQCPGVNEHIGEVWHSFPTILQAAEDSRGDTHTLQEQAVLFRLIRDYKHSLTLLRKIMEMDPQKAEDPEYLKLCIESYLATEDYQNVSIFLDLLKRTSQKTKTLQLFEDNDFVQKAYLQAARQSMLKGESTSVKFHFMSAFQDATVVSTKETSSPRSSPKDCSPSDSTNSDRDAVRPITAGGGRTDINPAGGPAADSEHCHVFLLHEEPPESIQKAESLIHVLQTFCGIRVTSHHREVPPGTPEWISEKKAAECDVTAVLAETDDHNDETLSHLISLAALRPSTVTLLTEGARVPDCLKAHLSFTCPDQLLRFDTGADETLDKNMVDVICQLLEVLCNARRKTGKNVRV